MAKPKVPRANVPRTGQAWHAARGPRVTGHGVRGPTEPPRPPRTNTWRSWRCWRSCLLRLRASPRPSEVLAGAPGDSPYYAMTDTVETPPGRQDHPARRMGLCRHHATGQSGKSPAEGRDPDRSVPPPLLSVALGGQSRLCPRWTPRIERRVSPAPFHQPVTGSKRKIPGVWGQRPQSIERDCAIGSLVAVLNSRIACRV
jgi:hypothetical protein